MKTYTIINPKFDTIYNNLLIFEKVNFLTADVNKHIYETSIYHWNRILKTKNNYLYRQKDKNDATIINIINNIINDDIYNKDIIVDNESLVNWAKKLHNSKNKYYFYYYCYNYGLEKTIEHIRQLQSSVSQKRKSITPTKKIVSVSTQQSMQTKPTGQLITINNVTNNIAGWRKITNLPYRDIDISKIKKCVLTPLKKDYIEISGIYATYEQWSLFINQHKTFIEDMIHKMSYDYTKQYLYNLVVNNTSFITNHIEITINNETHSLYYWSHKINITLGHLYNLRKKYGADYIINYINNQLIKQNV